MSIYDPATKNSFEPEEGESSTAGIVIGIISAVVVVVLVGVFLVVTDTVDLIHTGIVLVSVLAATICIAVVVAILRLFTIERILKLLLAELRLQRKGEG